MDREGLVVNFSARGLQPGPAVRGGVCVWGGGATRPRAVGVWVPCCAPRWRDVALRVEETAGGWQRVVG